MSAVIKTALEGNPEEAFFDSQMLPPQDRGVSFEALFFRQLQSVTNRIHETDNIDQIMLEVSSDICKLFNADRLTLYAVNDDRTALVSKVKTGLNSTQDLKLPIGVQSIAGYVAMSSHFATRCALPFASVCKNSTFQNKLTTSAKKPPNMIAWWEMGS